MNSHIGICEGGQIIEYRPQLDDPEFSVLHGPCPFWPGCGCEWDKIIEGEPFSEADVNPSPASVF